MSDERRRDQSVHSIGQASTALSRLGGFAPQPDSRDPGIAEPDALQRLERFHGFEHLIVNSRPSEIQVPQTRKLLQVSDALAGNAGPN